MKTAFIVVRTDYASVYHRTLQFAPFLADQGIVWSLFSLPDGYLERISLFRSLKSYDLVVLQRKLLNLPNLFYLRYFARRLAFDLDDALFLRDSKADRIGSWTRRVRFMRTARWADLVICGNSYIHDRVKGSCRAAAVVPTVVDLDRYTPCKRHEPGPGFTALWIGGRSTLFYLEKILTDLAPLAGQIPGFRLRVISDRFPESATIPVEKIPWSRETEVEAIRGADAGLMPLTDDDWSRGKCGLKLLQYGALGLPSVCSPRGVNKEIVQDGISGFHADRPEEWRRGLERLAADAELRSRMGAEARKIVEQRFSLQAVRQSYLELLRRHGR